MEESTYTFGPFQLRPQEHLLLRGVVPVPLAPKAYELLVALVSRAGRLVTRNELMQSVWPDSFVEEINLTVNISLLRKVLGEQPDGRSYIATVPKRGYRFDAPVVVASGLSNGAQEPRESASPAGKILPKPPAADPPEETIAAKPGSEDGLQRPSLAVFPVLAGLVLLGSLVLLSVFWVRHVRARAGSPLQAGRQESYTPEARELYAAGRAALGRRTVESVRQGVDFFREAVEIDPAYAAAWSGLADAYILAGSYGNSFLAPRTSMPMAKGAAEKALLLDPASPEAHTSLAYIRLTWDWDWAGAESEFRAAMRLDPGYVPAHHWYSHELMAEGRIAESHEESEKALDLEPTSVLMNEHMAWHHVMAREYERGIPQARKAIQLDPSFIQAHRVLGLAYLYTGRETDACAEFETGVRLSYNDPIARAYLARCDALSHRTVEARRELDALVKASAERYVSAAEIAAVYAALDDRPHTLEWLDKACEERASALIYLNVDPVYDRMRGDPRFQGILRRVGLMPGR